MDAWLTAALGVPVERSYLAVDPRNKSARVRVVITDIDPAYTSYAAVPHDKQGVPLVVWSLEDAIRRYCPAPGCVRVPAEPYTTPELEAALDAAMAPKHIQPLFRAHSNIEYVMAARCGDDGEVPVVLVGVTAKGFIPDGEELLPKSIKGVRVHVLDGRASLCCTRLRRGQDVSGGAKYDVGFGTLGGLVRHKTNKRVYLVTAAHVLMHVECKDESATPPVATPRERRCITNSKAALQWRHLLDVVGMSVDEARGQWQPCGDWDQWEHMFVRDYWNPSTQPSVDPILAQLIAGDDVHRQVAVIDDHYYRAHNGTGTWPNATFLDVAFLEPPLGDWKWDVGCIVGEDMRDGFVTKEQLTSLVNARGATGKETGPPPSRRSVCQNGPS